jgi:hypothetical protein
VVSQLFGWVHGIDNQMRKDMDAFGCCQQNLHVLEIFVMFWSMPEEIEPEEKQRLRR